jgi:hypothetical protein
VGATDDRVRVRFHGSLPSVVGTGEVDAVVSVDGLQLTIGGRAYRRRLEPRSCGP